MSHIGKEGTGPNLTFDDGETFISQFSVPNFWFHVTTAYDILRAQGVKLGKRDFLAAGKPFGA